MEDLNEILKTWSQALEMHGFHLSISKTGDMECKFNKRRRVSNLEVKVGDHIILQVTQFKYFGFIIQNDRGIKLDVNR